MKLIQPLILSIIFLLGSLAISISLNIILYKRGIKYYIDLNQTRLDPWQLNTYPPEANPPKNPQTLSKRVVFFGDSRVLSWPAPNLPNYEFINRGIGGQTSTQIKGRFDQHIRPLQPDIVVLQLGINDLKTIGLFPEKKAEIMANCRENIREIVKKSQELGAVVILTTIFPFGDIPLARKPFWSDDIFPAVKEINALIASLGDEDIIIFDTFSILADDRGMMQSGDRIDELHYNQRAYQKINQEFTELLKTID
jgi:lysophospholipase L1-like esterase